LIEQGLPGIKRKRGAPRPVSEFLASSICSIPDLSASIRLILYFQAIRPEAAFGPLAGSVCGAIAGVIALGALDGTNEFGLFHSSRIDTEIFGLVLYLIH
jgi:hypothetical protein